MTRVELFYPEQKTLTPQEFSEYWYANKEKRLTYRRLFTDLKIEKDIVMALDNNESVSFYVGEKKIGVTA